jgi:hypothetical protein
MTRAILGVTLAVVLMVPTVARANFGFFRSLFSGPNSSSSAYPPPAVVAAYSFAPPVVEICWPVPRSVVPSAVQLYSTPTPAPASSAEPPLAPRDTPMPPAGAGLTETRGKPSDKFFDSYFVASDPGRPALRDRCSVVFWNLTSQGLLLRVDGQSRRLERGASVRLELGREFRWGVAGREEERQQVPTSEGSVEIVIRR